MRDVPFDVAGEIHSIDVTLRKMGFSLEKVDDAFLAKSKQLQNIVKLASALADLDDFVKSDAGIPSLAERMYSIISSERHQDLRINMLSQLAGACLEAIISAGGDCDDEVNEQLVECKEWGEEMQRVARFLWKIQEFYGGFYEFGEPHADHDDDYHNHELHLSSRGSFAVEKFLEQQGDLFPGRLGDLNEIDRQLQLESYPDDNATGSRLRLLAEAIQICVKYLNNLKARYNPSARDQLVHCIRWGEDMREIAKRHYKTLKKIQEFYGDFYEFNDPYMKMPDFFRGDTGGKQADPPVDPYAESVQYEFARGSRGTRESDDDQYDPDFLAERSNRPGPFAYLWSGKRPRRFRDDMWYDMFLEISNVSASERSLAISPDSLLGKLIADQKAEVSRKVQLETQARNVAVEMSAGHTEEGNPEDVKQALLSAEADTDDAENMLGLLEAFANYFGENPDAVKLFHMYCDLADKLENDESAVTESLAKAEREVSASEIVDLNIAYNLAHAKRVTYLTTCHKIFKLILSAFPSKNT